MAKEQKVWLITGCSSGLGREIALTALARGDIVVATARDPAKLSDLAGKGALTEKLDVTSSDESLAATVSAITARTGGRIDVLVNNAGYILTGGVEEVSRDEAQATFDTNVFGQMNVLRAVLPVLRRQRSGTVANLGSIGGWYGTPGAGLYCATKACASILAEALRGEVAHLGINVVAIEPGYTRTDFLAPNHRVNAARTIDDLREGVAPTLGALDAYNGHQPGDPAKAARLIVDALTLSGSCGSRGPTLPPRLLIGSDANKLVAGYMDTYLENMKAWADLTTATDCN